MSEGCLKMHEIWSFILTWWKHSDVKSWFIQQICMLVSTLNLAYNWSLSEMPIMKTASEWALANPKGGFLQALRSPNHCYGRPLFLCLAGAAKPAVLHGHSSFDLDNVHASASAALATRKPELSWEKRLQPLRPLTKEILDLRGLPHASPCAR